MELRTYLAIIWRRKWIIAITTVITTIIATIFTLVSPPTYIATTTVRVATVGGGAISLGRTDINYTQLLMSTYATILTSGSVRSEIQEQLGLDFFPHVSADLIPNTELMAIQAEASNPESARDIANVASEILIKKSLELYSGTGQSAQEILSQQIDQIQNELVDARSEYERLLSEDSTNSVGITAASQSIELKERTLATLLEQYENARVNEALRSNAVSVVEYAQKPDSAARPRHDLNIVLGVIVGIIGGVAIALVYENLDTTLYSTQQIESVAKVTTIGKIPSTNEKLKIVQFNNGYLPELEAFRRLRTNILNANSSSVTQVIMVTSAERGEGKSTTVANLAVSIAHSGRKVLVIDCDMRLPKVHEIFNQPNKRGLTDVLIGNHELSEAIQDSVYPQVRVLTSGSTPPNPTELLGSKKMDEMISQLKEGYDFILLDTPALLSVSDAAVLVPMVNKVILIVARNISHREAVRSVRGQLTNLNAPSISVVINHAESNSRYTY